MKKILFFCAMMLGALCVSAQALPSGSDVVKQEGVMTTGNVFQDEDSPADSPVKYKVRITFGLNISNVYIDGNSSNSLIGFKGGSIIDCAIKKGWGFRSGLLLTSQGGKWHQNVNGGGISWSLNATENPYYLEIPLDVSYSYQYKDFTFAAFTGFPVSIGLFGDQKFEDGGTGNATVGDTTNSVFDQMNRFALSYNIGIEATWKRFTLGFEFNRHLTNDYKNGGTGHIQLFSINLGYDFNYY